MIFADPYQYATHCETGPQPGTTALAAAIMVNWPASGSDGIFNCRDIRGGGGFSVHAEGRAFDNHIDLVGGQPDDKLGHAILMALGERAIPLGIQLIIWNRRVYSNNHPWPEGSPYSGEDPHTGHLHIEQVRAKAAGDGRLTYDDAIRILRAGDQGQGGGDPLDPPTGDEFDVASLDDLRALLAPLATAGSQMRPVSVPGEEEIYAFDGVRFRHVRDPDKLNGLRATGALVSVASDTATGPQLDQAIEQTRLDGSFVACDCGRPTCRLKAA